MTIWSDEIVKRLYFRLSSDERKGLDLAIQSLRDIYPKIDIYEAILRGGAAISAGRKPLNQPRGKPLFVITRPTTSQPSCIKIRIDSRKDRKELEDALGRPWDELNSTRFNLSNFPSDAGKFNAFLREVRKPANLVRKRSEGNGYNPSDYNELTDQPAENEQGLFEGARLTVTVNKYERNRKARRECIAYHGSGCHFCGFDYGEKYGAAYAGFIQVHHVVPLSEINEEYEVDPIEDLVPVCPNCHALIHFGGEALSLEEAKSILSQHNKEKSASIENNRLHGE